MDKKEKYLGTTKGMDERLRANTRRGIHERKKQRHYDLRIKLKKKKIDAINKKSKLTWELTDKDKESFLEALKKSSLHEEAMKKAHEAHWGPQISWADQVRRDSELYGEFRPRNTMFDIRVGNPFKYRDTL